MFEFRILGPFEVAREGRPIALGGHKQRALLALLLLRRGDVVPAERLVQLLWGEQPPRTALTSLQNFVSQLRKALDPDVIETRPPGYRLRVDTDDVDLGRFERLTAEARAADDPSRRSALLLEALGLWRGEPLADFAYETWAQDEIRRLTELRLVANEDRVEANLEQGLHREIVPVLETLVAEHPLRERLRQLLMLALYRDGRQADALAVYAETRQLLVDQLGIEPRAQLQQLHASILRQETSLDPSLRVTRSDDHWTEVIRALLAGRLVTVLGPDVGPRNAADVVEHLTKAFGYPSDNGPRELTRVAQYVATMSGIGPLYDALHDLYAHVEPGYVHNFVATTLISTLRAEELPNPLIVTTGYDLGLEHALTDAGVAHDVVAYVASGRNRGRFWHLPPDSRPEVIEVPNTYATELAFGQRPVVLKLHGCVDTGPEREWESFVVTEDDYIEYLARDDISNLIPVGVAAKLRRSHFLFLGYALRDWNLRVLLNRLWGEEKVAYRSWAIQPEAPPLEREFWRRRDVDVYEYPLDEYVSTLSDRLAQKT